MEYKRERVLFLDVARAVAIISVVFGHSVECFYYMYQDRSILWGILGGTSRAFDIISITFGRLGVPIFLFLTGALVLNKKFENGNDCVRFYKKSFLPLLITMELWIVIWNLFLLGYRSMGGETAAVTFENVLKCVMFQKRVDTIMPAWYIPTIIGIYLFLPPVAIAVSKLPLRSMALPLTVAGVIFFGVPTANLFLSIGGGNQIEPSYLDVGFSGGTFGVYILVGYWIYSGALKKIPSAVVGGIGILAFAGCVALQYLMMEAGYPYKLEYNVLILLVCGTCVFELFKRIPNSKIPCPRVCTYLSRISLAIFFLHNPIQYTVYLSGVLSGFRRPVASVLMFVISFGLSVLFTWLLGMIRPIRSYIGIK